MIYPSIDELMAKVDSKYILVSLASKRARQLRENSKNIKVDRPNSKKFVGIALEEIYGNHIQYEKYKSIE
jgi:DNA-directed RNA polymerase subunit omega